MTTLDTRPTGLRRRSEEVQHHFAATRAYQYELHAPETVIQDVLRLHDQAKNPSCVGQALSSVDESVDGSPKSAIGIWILARFYQGDLANPDVGTDSAHGIRGMCNRGCGPYQLGEDTRPAEEYKHFPTLAEELAADDDRQDPHAEHKTLTSNRSGQAVDALVRGLGLIHGGPVNDAYQALQRDEVIEPRCVTGEDGHERRIFGYDAASGLFLELNSWGQWAGLTLPKGFLVPRPFTFCGIVVPAGPLTDALVLPGCAWLSPEALDLSWDADSLLIKVAA